MREQFRETTPKGQDQGINRKLRTEKRTSHFRKSVPRYFLWIYIVSYSRAILVLRLSCIQLPSGLIPVRAEVGECLAHMMLSTAEAPRWCRLQPLEHPMGVWMNPAHPFSESDRGAASMSHTHAANSMLTAYIVAWKGRIGRLRTRVTSPARRATVSVAAFCSSRLLRVQGSTGCWQHG